MGEIEPGALIPHMRLDELLSELHVRLEAVLATRDRVHALLNAVVSVGSDLDLETVLRRIVETAITLVDASYGALGAIGDENTLIQFIPVGLTEEEIARIENARLYEESRRREMWLQASSEVTTSLLSGAEPREVLMLIARRAREMAGADIVAVLLPDEAGRMLQVIITDGPVGDRAVHVEAPVADSLAGRAFTSGEPLPKHLIAPRCPPGASYSGWPTFKRAASAAAWVRRCMLSFASRLDT
ncbi:hypothetical protein FHR32_007405 [Streptosporangium album]|uniref:Histidine kinase n=1 Tax=Streptosporangium album TaxID=47479 RepID=A0A7W7WE28_9ACTN|nr:hypothetical protein [Streptosporangium album]